ncbi:MAG TPA: ATPase domain-containing protein [Nitrosopumilaceae archaeon]|nr:ATPase domain-containing protein [Nitrosopumilaceae archaeon]
MKINTKGSIITMNNSMHIPSELIDFLKRETYSLLIKGDAGTGKTTLALTILRALNINKNCLYISTRISPEQLFIYYPWLESFFGKSMKTELGEISEFETDAPVFVDARLDEPGSLFERITNQLMDVKSPIIIIDSWDAIGYFMDKEALMNNARVLQTWRERSRAKIIFVAEEQKDATLDFLVDGIVELQQKYYDDRRVREIFLLKLRGVRISRPSYIFTLNKNVFRSYEPYSSADYAITNSQDKKSENISQTFSNNHIKTGYLELDRILGEGLHKKSFVNIELDSNINAKVILAFLGKIISNFASTGNPVLLQPFEGINSEYLSRYLNSCLSKDAMKMLEILQFTSKSKITSSRSVSVTKYPDSTKQLESIQKNILKIQKKHAKKILLAIIGLDLSHESHTGDMRKQIKQHIESIKLKTDLFILITRHSQDNIQEKLSKISDMYLGVSEINSTLLLKSKIPWSHFYAIVIDRTFGYPNIDLEPIV